MNDSDEVDVSFNDSTFDEDSVSSWVADSDSHRNNWRGWKSSSLMDLFSFNEKFGKVLPLVELAAKSVANFIPFEVVENVNPPIPEQLHLRISFWSFPENEEDIRLYSCLANGNSVEFEKAGALVKNNKVKNMLQIGFHLSASVQELPVLSYEVSLTFDRRRIVSCNCSCMTNSMWCSHIIAVCLNRILDPNSVKLRAPVSESLSKLQRDQLQKFAQYLITELPQQILPTAQRLLDDLLSNKESRINTLRGAPDPTAGASVLEKTNWCLDLNHLHESIRKTLLKLSQPTAIVISDVIFLNANAPYVSTEWTSFLRPLRGKEPEGMWNLISIVKKLMKKNDGNSVVLLTVITEELIEFREIIIWWFKTKFSKYFNNCLRNPNSSNNPSEKNNYLQNNMSASQQASSWLCDEVVSLWRLTCLNPSLNSVDKLTYRQLLKDWHAHIMTTIYENCREDESVINENIKNPGFEPAIKACSIDWDGYPIPGITYSLTVKPNENDINDLTNSVMSVKLNVDLDSTQQPTCSKNLSVDSDFNVNKSNEPNINLSINNTSINSIVNNHNEILDNNNLNNKPINNSNNLNDNNESLIEKINNQTNNIDEELNSLYKFSSNAIEDDYLKYNQLSQKNKIKLDPIEIQLARAEALYAHGHNKYACELAIQLAENMLKHPPKVEFGLDYQNLKPGHQKNDHFNKTTSSNNFKLKLIQEQFQNALNQKPILQASDVYNKITFLCNVLIDNQVCLDLAFKIGILGLELARPPSSVKALEVKLFNQEQDLIPILKKIPLSKQEMDLLRLKAKKICNGELSRGSLLPLMLASFIFDALVISKTDPQKAKLVVKDKLPVDEYLGFECAVTAISLKCPVLEKDYPLLYEGIRRQRSEFVVNLLFYYRDEENRLVRIMEKLITDNNSNDYNSIHACDLEKRNSSINSYELIDYEKKYANCKCTLKRLSSKIHTRNNCIYTNNLIQPGKSKFKEKTKSNAKLVKAHFMFELAKSVLTKAGGNTSPSLFTNPTNDIMPAKPNRRLHICAFQLGLYALGLNNSTSMKWLQRTYSTHVSWVSAQAMDIGHPAINFLIETWKGHLVPSEAAALADRASRSRDDSMVLAAGKLAISCLTESQTLRLNEIKRAIVQCKEINEEMLIQALISIENSVKNGGLSSDILFETARNWYTLYEEHCSKEPEEKRDLINYIPNTDYTPSIFYPSFVLTPPPPYPHNMTRHRLSHHNNNHSSKQFHHFNASQDSQINCNNYNNFNSHYSYPIYNGPPSSNQLYEKTLSQALNQGVPIFDQIPYFNMPPPPMFPVQPFRSNFDQNYIRPNFFNNNTKMLQYRYPFNIQPKKTQGKLDSFLFNAYRLGIIAIDSLPKEIESKAVTAKFELNPPYHDDIVWLANVSSKLSPKHQQEFLTQVGKISSSPFVLYDLIMVIEKKFTIVYLNRPTNYLFTQLLYNAKKTFEECIHYKLYHLSQSDYDEFAKIVLKAKQIYLRLPDGKKSFQSKLNMIKSSCSDCILWNYVNDALKKLDNNNEIT